MENETLSKYAALSEVPCGSPLKNIDPDDIMMMLFMLLMFSGDPLERDTEKIKERARKMLEEIKRKEEEEHDVQSTDERA